MLTYATYDDFKNTKKIGNSGTVVVPSSEVEIIRKDLLSATRFIQRVTRRDFFPWMETRKFQVPHQYLNLRMQRFPSALLEFDNDLLEVYSVNNGVSDLDATSYFLLEPNLYPKSSIQIKFPAYWGGYAGVTTHYEEPVIEIAGLWGYADHRYPEENWIDSSETIPVGGLTNSAITLTPGAIDAVDEWGNSVYAYPGLLRIEDELVIISGKGASSVTLTRGARGSTAAAHAAGTPIQRWRVIEDIKQATIQIAQTWREMNASVNRQISIADGGAGTESGLPSSSLDLVKLYIRDYF